MSTHIIFQYKLNVLSSNFASMAAGASLVSLKVCYQEAEVEPGAPELTSELNPHKMPIFGWSLKRADELSRTLIIMFP